MTSTQSEQSVYQLKVTILGLQHPVWRRLQILGDSTLADLHDAIQAAMGWTDSHLHEFIIGQTRYGEPNLEEEYEANMQDEGQVLLSDVLGGEGTRFRYVYDFGDDWQHEVVVEEILPADPDVFYPICTGGQRACPPEDVGGAPGFEHFLEAMANPADPEHNEYMTWFGGVFDPDEFDLEEANEALRDTAVYTSTVYTTEQIDFVVYSHTPPYAKFYLFRPEGEPGLGSAAHNGHPADEDDVLANERIGILMLSMGPDGFEGDLYLDRRRVGQDEIEGLVDSASELLGELDEMGEGGLLALHWMEEIGLWDFPAEE
ncbi:MAG TPA: plasmid pRiA4b ORF-3 family protein [Anaerolineae bacterium]|nr:plasmid pRiA4b ORF-3 family protein [Anaerolineae bacterium]